MEKKIREVHTIEEANLLMENMILEQKLRETRDQWYADNDRHIREKNELRRKLSEAEKQIEALKEQVRIAYADTDSIKEVSDEAAKHILNVVFGFNPYQE